jgi:hypothetical protein
VAAARAFGVEGVDGAALERGDGVSTKPDSFSVSVWIATCTSISSATLRQLSMAAGVVPQSSCSFSRSRRPRSARSGCGSEALPLPRKPRFIGKASAACSMRAMCQGPGVQVVALVPVAGPVPPPSMVVMPDISASSICCGQMKWMCAVDAAGGEDHAFAGDDLGARPDDDGHAGLDVRVAGLADGRDAAVLDADVGLDDAPVIDDQRVGDDGIGTSARVRWLWPMPSRITLPPPNFTSSP